MKKSKITDNEKQILSYNAYHLDEPAPTEGWQMIKNVYADNGFEGQAYKKDNNVVVVFKGTDKYSAKDLKNDYEMVKKSVPEQQENAHELLSQVQQEYPDANIEMTGHSLGGCLAQIESARTGVPATTFNAYGTAEILRQEGYTEEQIRNMNIKNYGNPKDLIFDANIENQPGKIFVTNTDLDPEKTYGFKRETGLNIDISRKYHDLEKMGDLEDAVEVTLEKPSNADILTGQIHKIDYKYEESDNPKLQQHIYTREEIGKMSTDEYAKHEPAILKQMKEKGIPIKRELEEHRSKSSGKSSNGSNAEGRWVTINGNHVLIEN